MKFLHLIISTLLCLLPTWMGAQAGTNYANYNQYFGRTNIMLQTDLETGAITPAYGHSPLSVEGSCTVTNPATGQVLFYTDGNVIYDAHHQPMPNGQNLGACFSSGHGAVVAPVPGRQHQYYVFINETGHACTGNNLLVAIVDMRLNNGRGDVLSPPVVLLDEVNEGMVLVPKPDGGHWLLIDRLTAEPQITIMDVHDGGISPHGSRLTSSRHSFNLNFSAVRNQVLAISRIEHTVKLFGFDPTTGVFTSDDLFVPVDYQGYYDTELSPDGTKLYYSVVVTGKLVQVDLLTMQATLLYSGPEDSRGGGLWLAPDEKIYHITGAERALGVVNQPNSPGLSCAYAAEGLPLEGSINRSLNFASSVPYPPGYNPEGVHGIINKYAEVIAVCGNRFEVIDAAAFNVSDTVIINSVKGATVDPNEGPAAGSVTSLGNAGILEYNVISGRVGNTIFLERVPETDFNPEDVVQLISVPYLGEDVTTNGLTCRAWNGKTGGVLAFSTGRLRFNAGGIDVSGKGFRGGVIINNPSICGEPQRYNYGNDDPGYAACKGEGFNVVALSALTGAARNSCGGGGPGPHNHGGGGGNEGGLGGYRMTCPNAIQALGGNHPGILMGRGHPGGGGGAGNTNNFLGSDGGNGGGLVVASVKELVTNEHRIRANGSSVGDVYVPGSLVGDGAGGGGGGGAIILDLPSSQPFPILIEARGGYGGSCDSLHGPGGGGGGGFLMLSNNLPNGLTYDARGGLPGTDKIGSTLLATAGEDGDATADFNLPFPEEQFVAMAFVGTPYVTSLCDSTSELRFEYIGTGVQSYLNDTTINESPVTDLPSGVYTLTIRNGCEELERALEVKNYAAMNTEVLFADSAICSLPGGLEVYTEGGKTPIIHNIEGDQISGRGGLFSQLSAGPHILLARDDRGCEVFKSVSVPDASYPLEVHLPAELSVGRGGAVLVAPEVLPRVSPPLNYRWEENSHLDCHDCAGPFYENADFNDRVEVTITDSNGCVGSDSSYIRVLNTPVYLPNVFSPDGNGTNDRFRFFTSDLLPIVRFHLRIHDRQGGVVYEQGGEGAPASDFGWDGSANGKPMNPGVFVYILEIELAAENKIQLDGDFQLLR